MNRLYLLSFKILIFLWRESFFFPNWEDHHTENIGGKLEGKYLSTYILVFFFFPRQRLLVNLKHLWRTMLLLSPLEVCHLTRIFHAYHDLICMLIEFSFPFFFKDFIIKDNDRIYFLLLLSWRFCWLSSGHGSGFFSFSFLMWKDSGINLWNKISKINLF